MDFTNTKVHKNDDGSICIWFSPDGNPRVRYFAKGYVGKSSLQGHIELHLLKKGEDWGDVKKSRISWGNASWFGGHYFPFQPLGEKAENTPSGFCPTKHQHALIHAIDSIPKLKQLLK